MKCCRWVRNGLFVLKLQLPLFRLDRVGHALYFRSKVGLHREGNLATIWVEDVETGIFTGRIVSLIT